jgi:hypothetical protein
MAPMETSGLFLARWPKMLLQMDIPTIAHIFSIFLGINSNSKVDAKAQ